jgi:uncharacterized membrane protein YfcA
LVNRAASCAHGADAAAALLNRPAMPDTRRLGTKLGARVHRQGHGLRGSMPYEIALIVAGALAGGFINGLSGFGMGLAGVALWVYALPPTVVAPLAAACAVVAQIQALPLIWRYLEWPRLAPFLIGGVLGIVPGTWLLANVSLPTFKFWIGVLIVGYCTIRLATGSARTIAWGGKAADGFFGLIGGVLGGLAGVSGPVPTIWVGLRPWNKIERRCVIQMFNLVILALVITSHATAGLLGTAFLKALALSIPAVLAGAFLGQRLYRRLDDHSFDRVVLGVLLAAGLALIASAWK